MYSYVELFLNSAMAWVYMHATWAFLLSILYSLSVPWIIWAALVLVLGLRTARIPPPTSTIVKEVLGTNPLTLGKDESNSDSQGNRQLYCMRVVAHRGGGYDYPENSLSAFRNTKEKGCSAVEFDVSLTKDKVPIIFHDATIERLTGRMGIVKDMTWEQLKELDITHNHPLREKFAGGEKIALLDDVLEECLLNGQRLFIDIKERSTDIVQVILDSYSRHPALFKRAVVTSFNPVIIYLIRRKEPRVVASLAWRPNIFARLSYKGLEGLGPVRFHNPFKHMLAVFMDALHSWALPRFTYYLLGLSVILLHKDVVTPEVVRQWHERGVRVMVWTVNLPSEKLHYSRLLKVTYLTDTLLAEATT